MVKRTQGPGHGAAPPALDPATRSLICRYGALTRAQQRAALGELAARLSHLLRNPLSGVLLSLVNLRAEIRSADQDERLGLAIAELERVGHLLSGLLEASRPLPECARPLDLHGLVQEMALLAGACLADGVTLIAQVPSGLRCRLPELGLRLALFALISNAGEALAGRPGTIRLKGTSRGGRVEIAVSDDGPGFAEARLPAGAPDAGAWPPAVTGLGLAAVRRFAEANAGQLQLSNQVGGGACARLDFPLEDPDG